MIGNGICRRSIVLGIIMTKISIAMQECSFFFLMEQPRSQGKGRGDALGMRLGQRRTGRNLKEQMIRVYADYLAAGKEN